MLISGKSRKDGIGGGAYVQEDERGIRSSFRIEPAERTFIMQDISDNLCEYNGIRSEVSSCWSRSEQ